ncbi:MAG: hypothetical protein JXR96_00650 [Deltaproteobacteria bacterium]|nr:hypothetical protein [Deltaproteobacteria bacterium]
MTHPKEKARAIRVAGEERAVSVQAREPGRIEALVDGRALCCTYRSIDPQRLRIQLGDRSFTFHLAVDRGRVHASAMGCHARIEPVRARRGAQDRAPPPEVTPPMPAVVVELLVALGDRVVQGQPVVVVSAMKMESTLVAPHDGVVSEIRAAPGDKVSPGDVLVTVTKEGSNG